MKITSQMVERGMTFLHDSGRLRSEASGPDRLLVESLLRSCLGDTDANRERIATVGYINGECRHALISIYHLAMINAGGDGRSVQVVISIEGARTLRSELTAFLTAHGINVVQQELLQDIIDG